MIKESIKKKYLSTFRVISLCSQTIRHAFCQFTINYTSSLVNHFKKWNVFFFISNNKLQIITLLKLYRYYLKNGVFFFTEVIYNKYILNEMFRPKYKVTFFFLKVNKINLQLIVGILMKFILAERFKSIYEIMLQICKIDQGMFNSFANN